MVLVARRDEQDDPRVAVRRVVAGVDRDVECLDDRRVVENAVDVGVDAALGEPLVDLSGAVFVVQPREPLEGGVEFAPVAVERAPLDEPRGNDPSTVSVR